MCLPVSDEPKLEKDGSLNCVCQEKPKDKSTFKKVLNGVATALEVAAHGPLIFPVTLPSK